MSRLASTSATGPSGDSWPELDDASGRCSMKTTESERDQILRALGALGDLAQPTTSFERLPSGAAHRNTRRRPVRWIAAAAALVALAAITAGAPLLLSSDD